MPIEKISYTLSKEDFLQHLLYAISKTPSVNDKRKKYKNILPILYLLIGVIGAISGNMILFSSLLLLAIVWWIFYPKLEAKLYKNRYSKYLDQQQPSELGKTIELDFQSDNIFQKEENITYSIEYQQIQVIHEIKDYIYLGLKDGYTIIIPKQQIKNPQSIIFNIKSNAPSLDIPIIEDLNWKWS